MNDDDKVILTIKDLKDLYYIGFEDGCESTALNEFSFDPKIIGVDAAIDKILKD